MILPASSAWRVISVADWSQAKIGYTTLQPNLFPLNDLRQTKPLKKQQLKRRRFRLPPLFPKKDIHSLHLLVSDRHYPNFTVRWQAALYAPNVHFRIFLACAMPCIHGKLHFMEPILQQVLAKTRIRFFRRFGLRWQVKHHKHPHTPVSVYKHGLGISRLFALPSMHRTSEVTYR